jgi:hypothetical protein
MKLHRLIAPLVLALLVPALARAAEPPATDPHPLPSVPEPSGDVGIEQPGLDARV